MLVYIFAFEAMAHCNNSAENKERESWTIQFPTCLLWYTHMQVDHNDVEYLTKSTPAPQKNQMSQNLLHK